MQDSAETLSSWTSGWTNPNGEKQWRNNRGDTSVFGLAYQVMGAAGATGPLSAVASGSNSSAAFIIAFHGLVTAVAPTITTPPANVTVTAPNPASFSVVASGTAPLSYQWRRNGTPIGGATGALGTR